MDLVIVIIILFFIILIFILSLPNFEKFDTYRNHDTDSYYVYNSNNFAIPLKTLNLKPNTINNARINWSIYWRIQKTY